MVLTGISTEITHLSSLDSSGESPPGYASELIRAALKSHSCTFKITFYYVQKQFYKRRQEKLLYKY